METACGYSKDLVQHWQELALESSPVRQLVEVHQDGRMACALVGEGGKVLARGLSYEDAVFMAEAAEAVDTLAEALKLLVRYAEYVKEANRTAMMFLRLGVECALLPQTFMEWMDARKEEDGGH